ncbi:glycoside hydrolase family 18 [Sphingobacterium bovistauri]|uniref:Glycoside hydrolase Family 18, chitinase_18 n=1 Tax=Sphingobacterium bovistauri TaxID=2781959 RepID=A0ABS7Z6Z2_9SPHI|nr:glycoside hydrolase family 18 [Sphingobacterium bovistauri]MCA5005322.1 hypothetical protein [Sphingobacterium bovistauri]
MKFFLKNRIFAVNYLAICSLLFGMASCNKITPEPIDVIVPTRSINTSQLLSYKSNLANRNIAVGIIYDWGIKDGSQLMHTPDSLDMIIIRGDVSNLSEVQQKDLENVQSIKGTKVLSSFEIEEVSEDLPKNTYPTDSASTRRDKLLAKWVAENPSATFAQRRAQSDTIYKYQLIDAQKEYTKLFVATIDKKFEPLKANLEQLKNSTFDGISIKLPSIRSGTLTDKDVDNLISDHISNIQNGLGKKLILIIENPQEVISNAAKIADWLIYNQNTAVNSFANFSNSALFFPSNKFIASVDLSSETDEEGFADTDYFGPNGILSRSLDITNWSAPNKAGVAYIHLEKDYHNLSGNLTYSTVRYGIKKIN